MPLALALAAAFFAKLFGLVYLLVLLPALVLATSRERFWNLVRRYALACSLAFLGGALFVALMYPYLGDTVSTLVNQKVGFIQCPDLICQGSLLRADKANHDICRFTSGFYSTLPQLAWWRYQFWHCH